MLINCVLESISWCLKHWATLDNVSDGSKAFEIVNISDLSKFSVSLQEIPEIPTHFSNLFKIAVVWKRLKHLKPPLRIEPVSRKPNTIFCETTAQNNFSNLFVLLYFTWPEWPNQRSHQFFANIPQCQNYRIDSHRNFMLWFCGDEIPKFIPWICFAFLFTKLVILKVENMKG